MSRRAALTLALLAALPACGSSDTPTNVVQHVGSHELPHADHRAEATDPTAHLAEALAAVDAAALRTSRRRAARDSRTRSTITARTGGVERGGSPLTSGADFWHRLAQCESGGRLDPPGRYIGTFQFSPDTAAKLGVHRGDSYATQQAAAEKWSHMVNPASTSGWPVCWRKATA